MLQCFQVFISVLHFNRHSEVHIAIFSSVLQRVVVCVRVSDSILLCVAVFYSVLQCYGEF